MQVSGREKEMVFHQDTLPKINKREVRFIIPVEWVPKSPGAAPVDFGIWGNYSETQASKV